MVPDFSGYATKNDLLCSDGRTIRGGAFSKDDGRQVPLVWQHKIDTPENILGHAILKEVADGVRVDAFFNDTPNAELVRTMLDHGDINQLSIRAGSVKHQGMDVVQGSIQEVSLVVKGANPGASIDFINVKHDGETGDEIIHYTDIDIETFEEADAGVEHYGVKGMRWGHRKAEDSGGKSEKSEAEPPKASSKATYKKAKTDYKNEVKAVRAKVRSRSREELKARDAKHAKSMLEEASSNPDALFSIRTPYDQVPIVVTSKQFMNYLGRGGSIDPRRSQVFGTTGKPLKYDNGDHALAPDAEDIGRLNKLEGDMKTARTEYRGK